MQKKESKFSTADFIIIVFCIAGACFSAAAFWQEYNNTLVRLDEEPVGTIIFRKGVAQRRFIDRNMWDRLQQATPVYHGDTIRTIEQSEAIIIFKDEVTHLSLDERTIIQVFFDSRRGANVDFSAGHLGVYSENNDVFITSGNSRITANGQIMMNRDDEGFILSVLDGFASFDGTEIEAGGILAIDSEGEINTAPIIAMTSFGASAHILGSHTEAVPVVFSWNSANFKDDTYVIIQVAHDRTFNQILETRAVSDASSVSIYLESGSYWWRAFPLSAAYITEVFPPTPQGSFFPSGHLNVVPVAAAVLRSPPPGEELIFRSGSSIPLSWSAVEGAYAYLVEISANTDMSRPVVSRQVEVNSVVQTALDFGRWYWRVTPVFPRIFVRSAASDGGVSAAHTVSEVSSFYIMQGDPVVAEPVLTFPLQNGKVFIGSAGETSASRLFWAYDRNAESWLVELSDNPGMLNPVVRQTTASNFFKLPPDLLRGGQTWFWRVTALGGQTPAVSQVRNFEVSSEGAPVSRPVLAAFAQRQPPPAEPLPTLHPIIFGANAGNWNDLDAERRAANDTMLSSAAAMLNANSGLRLMIEGHANPLTNPADTAARNREETLELQPLSELRARAVFDRFVELGINPGRLEYTGMGGKNPAAAWEDRANWWRNRRVEIVWVE